MDAVARGGYCTYVTGMNCSAAVSACSDLTVTATIDNSAYCKASVDYVGNKCSYTTGESACRTGLACESASFPKSQADCDY